MPLQLVIALHNHQPVGNLPFVLAEAYRDAYEPMLDLIDAHPLLRFTCHYTGPLLKWIEHEHPECLERLAAMAARGQVELLGGGLYEPILAVIPDADKLGQVQALTTWLESHLGVHPEGAWLAERVWEPHLPLHLARAGIAYTILDEEHFAKAGMDYSALDGYYVTEDQGHTLRLFPASTELRYLIPWRDVDEVMAFLRARYEAGQSLLVFADDGEKFGSWPGTHQHCYGSGWLERFLVALEANQEWLQTTTPSMYLRQHPSSGRIYIPTASYHEMEEWSLDSAAQRTLVEARKAAERAGLQETARHVRAGLWRNFLRRYAEANVLQQRATAVSTRVHAMPAGERRDEALDHLWQGQCNCPYWHGVFGGIYMYHIRQETFSQVIAADVLADTTPAGRAGALLADCDADGSDEALIATAEQAVFVSPHDGAIYEWDLRPPRHNLLNTLAAYREAYHDGPAPALPARPRHAFAEMLLDSVADATEWATDAVEDLACWGPVGLSVASDGGRATASVSRAATVRGQAQSATLSLNKTLSVDAGSRDVWVHYRAQAMAMRQPSYLAVEVCLAPPAGCHVTGSIELGHERRGLMEAWGTGNVTGFSLDSGGHSPLRLTAECSLSTDAATHPLLSSHRSEHGEERVYQGTRVVLVWRLPGDPGQPWEVAIRLHWETSSS